MRIEAVVVAVVAHTAVVECLFLQVTVPVDAEILHYRAVRIHCSLSVNRRDISVGSCRRHQTSWIGVREVSCNATTIVPVRRTIEIDFGCGSVAKHRAWLVLMTSEDFFSPSEWVEVGSMLSVSMSTSCCTESFAVVVDNHRAIDYLITSVQIHIVDAEVVETLSEPRTTACLLFPIPALRQFVCRRVDIESLHVDMRIDASTD